MNKKAIMLSFIVAMAVLLTGLVSATDLTSNVHTEMNSVMLSSCTDNVVFADNTIPVRVTFTANADADDVEIDVSMTGLREDVQDSSGTFDIVAGKTYTKLLALELPSTIDELTEEDTLYVDITSEDRDLGRFSEDYKVTIQRESFEFRVLSVDYNSQVTPGEVFPISVVLKNTGYQRTDDAYVVASIPELGVSSRGYAGDLIPYEDYIDYDDEEDSTNEVVRLKVPEGTKAGVYELVITVYNDDTETEMVKLISVSESLDTQILASTKTQDVSAGETALYDLIIVNTASKAKVFRIDTTSTSDVTVTAPSVVAVGSGESETVTFEVTVPEDTQAGTKSFSADVDGETFAFTANVVKGVDEDVTSVSPSIVGLTVVLVIVFVVLLIVLIILISRKDNSAEEVETSYY